MQFVLRPRQKEFVEKCLAAVARDGNTLGVAPTGSGKTVMGSSIVTELLHRGGDRALILQHREELIRQNRSTFYDVAGRITPIGTVNAEIKQFDRPVTFASVQTLCRDKNLDRLPPPTIILTDEAHHAVAPTYRVIYDRFPEATHIGLTATPNRGDGKTLRPVFCSVADQIPIGDLIKTGVLVPPQTHIIDLDVKDQIEALRPTLTGFDYDLDAVAGVLNRPDINKEVVRHWKALGGDRKTVVFCSNLQHVEDVYSAFAMAGGNADFVDGSMNKTERRKALDRFENGETQVMINCGVLTEGWDCQPCSCVILLRASSYLSTLIQMIGRGLRKLNPVSFPKAPPKENCIVLDFGTSLLRHGTLEQTVDLSEQDETFEKTCPNCLGTVPTNARICPLCAYEFTIAKVEKQDSDKPITVNDFGLTEIDILGKSPFTYQELFDGSIYFTTTFNIYATCVFFSGKWCAIGKAEDNPARVLYRGERVQALCECDDFMKAAGAEKYAAQIAPLRHFPADDKQRKLHAGQLPPDATRYHAACLAHWKLSEAEIRQLVTNANAAS